MQGIYRKKTAQSFADDTFWRIRGRITFLHQNAWQRSQNLCKRVKCSVL